MWAFQCTTPVNWYKCDGMYKYISFMLPTTTKQSKRAALEPPQQDHTIHMHVEFSTLSLLLVLLNS